MAGAGAPTAVAAAPANDMFATATVISGAAGTTSGTNVAATKQAGEPNHAGNSGGKSVWYRWTAPATRAVTIDTVGSAFDTVLAVYTGTAVSALSGLGDDDGAGSTLSRVRFGATAGTTYQIAVDGKVGSGALKLNWSTGPAGPANDMLAAARLISGAAGTTSATNASATMEPGEPAHVPPTGTAAGTNKTSVWYRWTAPATATVAIDTAGSAFDTLLAVYTGSAVDALTKVAVNDSAGAGSPHSRVVVDVTAGTVYRIAVDGMHGAAGALKLTWATVMPPVNDRFTAATAISGATATIGGTNLAATKQSGEPNHAGNAGGTSVWYHWTAPKTASATIDTVGSAIDTLLAVYTGAAVNTLSLVASNDDLGFGSRQSRVRFQAIAGTVYRIAVDGFLGAEGAVTLHLSSVPAPANDSFAAATAIAGLPAAVSGTNVASTKEAAEPNHAGHAGGKSVWYRWTAPATRAVTIDTVGSAFDTLLGRLHGRRRQHAEPWRATTSSARARTRAA